MKVVKRPSFDFFQGRFKTFFTTEQLTLALLNLAMMSWWKKMEITPKQSVSIIFCHSYEGIFDPSAQIIILTRAVFFNWCAVNS